MDDLHIRPNRNKSMRDSSTFHKLAVIRLPAMSRNCTQNWCCSYRPKVLCLLAVVTIYVSLLQPLQERSFPLTAIRAAAAPQEAPTLLLPGAGRLGDAASSLVTRIGRRDGEAGNGRPGNGLGRQTVPEEGSGAADLNTAATLKNGLQSTMGAGSVKDPDILDLATVQELAAMDPDLTQLNKLLQDMGATFYLEQSRDITMFMPTDKAFRDANVHMQDLPWSSKWRILQYHIVPNVVIKLEDMRPGNEHYSTWEGSDLLVSIPDSNSGRLARRQYKVNDAATVVGDPPGIENFNGISYKIDQLLVPETVSESSFVIEDHQSTGVTRRDSNGSDQGEKEGVEKKVENTMETEEDTSGVQGAESEGSEPPKFVGRLDPTRDVVTGHETPKFVQDINAAHSQWNETPAERRQRLTNDRNAAAGLTSGGDASDSDAKGEEGSEVVGLLSKPTGSHDNSATAEAKGSSTSADVSSNDENPGNGGRIHALAIDETEMHSPAVTISGADVPKNYGWAGVSPGWNHHTPGQVVVVPGSQQPQESSRTYSGSRQKHRGSSPNDSSGITSYRPSSSDSEEEDSGLTLAQSRRQRNRRRRYESRMARLGITISEDDDRYGGAFRSSFDTLSATEDNEQDFPQVPTSIYGEADYSQSDAVVMLEATADPTQPLLFPMNLASDQHSHSVSTQNGGDAESGPAKAGISDTRHRAEITSPSSNFFPHSPPQHHPSGEVTGLLPHSTDASGLIGAHSRLLNAATTGASAGDGGPLQTSAPLRLLQGTEYVSDSSPEILPLYPSPSASHAMHASSPQPVSFPQNSHGSPQSTLHYISTDGYYTDTYGQHVEPSVHHTTTEIIPSYPSANLHSPGSVTYSEYSPMHGELVTHYVDGSGDLPHLSRSYHHMVSYREPVSLEIVKDYQELDIMSIVPLLPELSALNGLMNDSRLGERSSGSSRLAKRVKMTLFAPIDSAINLQPENEPHGSSLSNSYDSIVSDLNITGLSRLVSNNHMSMGRQVWPDRLIVDKEMVIPAKGHRTKIRVRKDSYGNIFVNDVARVVRIIYASNGLIYEIDRVLMPKYNDGPTLQEFIQLEPSVSIYKTLMGGSGLMGRYNGIGPITVFLVANSGFVTKTGQPLPQCALDALNRPEAKNDSQKLAAHMILEDIHRAEDMLDGNTLHPIYGPPLKVSRVEYWYDEHTKGGTDVFVEGSKIIRPNIPIHNGILHIIEARVPLPDVDMDSLSYWTCLDQHLRTTTRQVRVALERVDEYKSLPVLGAPPGPRPAWVGYGLPRYFPPHTTYREHSRQKRGGLGSYSFRPIGRQDLPESNLQLPRAYTY